MSLRGLAGYGLMGLVAVSGMAGAGPITDRAGEIERMAGQGDTAGAILAARGILADLWAESPEIGFTDNLLVIEPAAGFGIFNPRPDNRFKPGEPIVLYAEPFGYGYGAPGEGLHAIGFIVDLQLLSATGEVLGDAPNVAEIDMTSRWPVTEFPANITYNLDGIGPGTYRLVTTLRDKNSAKFGSFETDIVIAQ